MAVIDFEDIKMMRRAGTDIRGGRKVKPGDFYLEKKTLTAIDPITKVRTYSAALEMCLPSLLVLKGDEHEIVAGMKITAGDIIVTFSYAKNIPTSVPNTINDSFYDRVQYKDDYYKILNVWPKGLGIRANRKVLFAAKEP